MKKLIITAMLATTSSTVFAGQIATPVPEPSTWLLFGAAAVAVLAIKKFKK